jgi:rhomboid protease GluP
MLEPGRFIVTPVLVAMNVAYFLAMVSVGVSPSQPSAAEVLPFGANFGALTVNGEWWRLLSSTFIHYGFLHLGFNMWCLWSLGNIAERLFGGGRFLTMYVLSGLGGSAASLVWHPYVVSAGASGAVFGIAGGLASFLYLARIHLPQRAVRDLLTSILIFIGFNLAFGFTVPGIDNAGHLGGLVVGAALGATLRIRRAFPLAAAAVAVALVAMAPLAQRIARANPIVMLTEADLLRAADDNAAAIAKLEGAVEAHPEFASGHEALALMYLQEGHYEKSIDAARRAVELDPQLEGAQQILGTALYLNRDYEDAVDQLRFAIQLNPDELATRANLSRALVELGRGDEAVAALEEAMKWEPDSSYLHSEMGLVRLENGELDLAVQSLEKAVELAPDEPESYNRLSLVLARAGKHDEALRAVEKAIELRPGAAHILDSLGTVRLYRDELDDAVAAYRDAIELDPDSGVYHYNLSVALARMGNDAEAEAARAKAFELDPKLNPPADGSPLM